MTSSELVMKLLENILPLLLSVIILLAIIFFLIQKITSPFSKFGNFLFDKYNRLTEVITQSRKDKFKRQIESQNIKIRDLEIKYNIKTEYLIEIKKTLNDLSKYFSELNQFEMRRELSKETIQTHETEIAKIEQGGSKNFFEKLVNKTKAAKVLKEQKKIEIFMKKNDENIEHHKKMITQMMDELVAWLNTITK
jgi:hypothetical protein